MNGPPPNFTASRTTGSIHTANPRRCPDCGSRYPADFKVCPRDATPLEDAPLDEDPVVGSVVGESYEIVRIIGEGGMGRVYEARHTRLHKKRYAVKMLHQELARQPEVVTRFQREAEAASALVHPHVVGVYDVNITQDGTPYIVGELLEGVELGRYLDQVGKLPTEAAVRVVRQICHALGAAHRHGIVHRDVKPENVFLVGDESHVKVLDFGISKVAEGNATLTKTGMVMGTPAYMAPEQARGARVDARADVYAVGAILYRCVTGRDPFEGLDQMGTLAAVLSQEPERPSVLEPSIPPALELVIQRAMAKNPDERHASMEELAQDLSGFDPASVSLLPPPPGTMSADTSLERDKRRAQTAPTIVADRSRGVRLARPALVLLSIAGLSWAGAGLWSAIVAILVLAGVPTRSELVLSAVGALALMVTPAVLWVRHIVRSWQLTPRVLELGARVKLAFVAALVTYGSAALAAQYLQLFADKADPGVFGPASTIVLYLLGLAAGFIAWFVSGRTQQR